MVPATAAAMNYDGLVSMEDGGVGMGRACLILLVLATSSTRTLNPRCVDESNGIL
jgi:purine-cytosine permease-like protein